MKTILTTLCALLGSYSFLYAQDTTHRFMVEVNGNFDLKRTLTGSPTTLWRIDPTVMRHISNGFFVGADLPLIYLHTQTTSARGISLFGPNGTIIQLKSAQSINAGLGLFVRKNILLSEKFLTFWQVGLGYHVFYGNAKTTEPEPFIQRHKGFARNARIGLTYKLNERYWLNTHINYSNANRLNIFVEEGPSAVSLQFGVTFLPHF
ncbi:MAG: hypothetical protein LH606_00015 [Cytophagaceae bacterium]|nr:hypothetical protein [Cytophagaceae bacterium]